MQVWLPQSTPDFYLEMIYTCTFMTPSELVPNAVPPAAYYHCKVLNREKVDLQTGLNAHRLYFILNLCNYFIVKLKSDMITVCLSLKCKKNPHNKG